MKRKNTRTDNRKRKQQTTELTKTFSNMPNEIWLKIFQQLVPKKDDSCAQERIDDLYNCRLVCKSWAQNVSDKCIWEDVIYNFGHLEHFFSDLCYDQNNIYRRGQVLVSPPTYFAQITFRGIQLENVTTMLLQTCFRKQRWKLLFHTMQPILQHLKSGIYYSDSGDYSKEEYLREKAQSHFSRCNSSEEILSKTCTEYYGYGAMTLLGDMFFVRRTGDMSRNRKTLIYHYDRIRGDHLELRGFIKGGGLDQYFHDAYAENKHVRFGLQIAMELLNTYSDVESEKELSATWRKKCVNIAHHEIAINNSTFF
jgi:hypothetical protein